MDEFYIGELIIDEEVFIGNLELDSEKIYPKLENIIIKPLNKEQVFKHPDSYGYDEIFVERVHGDELIVKPTTEEQINEGLYNKVTVPGDSNLIPENIKKGVTIFGVMGTYEGKALEDIEIEYIEATGNQFIDTGIAPSDDLKIEMEYTPTNTNIQAVFGSSWVENGYFLMIYFSKFRFHSNGNVSNSSNILANTKYKIETTTKYLKVDDVVYNLGNNTTKNTTDNIRLFSVSSNKQGNNGSGKLYYCKIYRGDTLVRDLIPILNTQRIACLYDKVNNEYFFNDGTGAFKAGNVIN